MSQRNHKLDATIDAALDRYPIHALPPNFTKTVMMQLDPRPVTPTMRLREALYPYRMELGLALLLTLCFALIGLLVMLGAQMGGVNTQSVTYSFAMSKTVADWIPLFACVTLAEVVLCIYLWQKWTVPAKCA